MNRIKIEPNEIFKTIKPQTYKITPENVNLRPNQKAFIDIKLNLKSKTSQKDYFLIKGDFFEKKVTIRVVFDNENSTFEKKPPSRKNSFERKRKSKEVRFEDREDDDQSVYTRNFEPKKFPKEKLRKLENELFEKDKKINDLKFKVNDLELQLDEKIGQILDLERENDELNKQSNFSRLGSSYQSLSGKNPLFCLEENFSEIKKLLEKETPEIKDLVLGVVRKEWQRLRDEYNNMISNFEKERENFLSTLSKEKVKKIEIQSNGGMRNYLNKVESQVRELENELKLKNIEVGKLKEELIHVSYKEKNEEISKRNLKDQYFDEVDDKLKLDIRNDGLVKKIEVLENQNSALKGENYALKEKIEKSEFLLNVKTEKNFVEKSQKNLIEEEFSKLLKQHTQTDLRLKQAVKRVEFIKETIFDILQFLELQEAQQEGNDEREIDLKNRKKNFMENISIFINSEEDFDYSETFNALEYLENALNDEKERNEILQEQSENLKNELNSLEIKIKNKEKKHVEKSKSKNREFENMNFSYENERLKLLNEIERLNSLISQEKRKNSGIQSEKIFDSQAKKIQNLSKKIHELEEVNEDLLQKLAENSSRISKMSTLENKIIDLEQENHELKTEKYQRGENLNLKILNEKNDKIEKKQKIIEELNEKIVQLTSQITQRNNLISELHYKIQEGEKKMEKFEIDEEKNLKEISRMKKYCEENENSKHELLKEVENKMKDVGINNMALVEQLNEMNVNYKNLEKLCFEYEKKLQKSEKSRLKFENLNKELKKKDHEMENEVKDLRVNIDKHVNSKLEELDKYKTECNKLEKENKNLKEKNEKLEKEYKAEIDKMMKFHSTTIDMMKDEIQELDKRLISEMDRRKEDSQKWQVKERSYINELTLATKMDQTTEKSYSSRKKRGRKKSFKSESSSALSQYEAQLKQKHHEVVDLEAQLDSKSRENSKILQQLERVNSQLSIIKEENTYLKSRNSSLQESLKKSKILSTISSKSDLDIIKELNDLRENVMDLKAERNRVLEQLKDNNLLDLGEKKEKEITSECFLGYIKRLIEDKKSLGEIIGEKEDDINTLVKKNLVFEEKCKNQENEILRIIEESEKLRREVTQVSNLVKEKNVEILKLEELLSRQKIEFEAGINEQKIIFKQAESERKRVFFSVKNLKTCMKEMEKDCKETLKMQQNIAEIERKRFLKIINDVRSSLRFSNFENKNEHEILKEILVRVIKSVNVIANKEAKIKEIEEKNKRVIIGKKKLKKEIKCLRDQLASTVVEIENLKNPKKVLKKSTLKKNLKKLQEEILGVIENKEELDEDKLSLKENLRILESEIISKVAKMRKKDKEIELLKEKMEDLKFDLNAEKSKYGNLRKENKTLNKTLNKNEKNFKKEVKNLVNKIESSNEIINLKNDNIAMMDEINTKNEELKILHFELKQKKDSLDSIRILKETLEKKNKKLKEKNKSIDKKNSKLENEIKEEKRKSENMKVFRKRYQELKIENEENRKKNLKIEKKILDLKNDVDRKDNIIEQMRKRLDNKESEIESLEKIEKLKLEQKKTLKKLKKDLERKTGIIENLQNKILQFEEIKKNIQDKHEEEITKLKAQTVVKRVENRKLKEDTNRIYFLEQIIGNLRMIVRRVYKENLSEVYKNTVKNEEEISDKETLKKYQDSMAILEMGEDELSQFMGIGNVNAKSNYMDQMEEEMKKFDLELSKGEDINPQRIFKLIKEVVEDRVHAFGNCLK